MEYDGKFWVLSLLVVVCFFVLGMTLQKSLSEKQWLEILNNYKERVDNSIKKYEFGVVAYSKVTTQEPIREPFACVLGNGEEMERMYLDLFIPALNGQSVCFVNTLNLTQSGGTNELIQQ